MSIKSFVVERHPVPKAEQYPMIKISETGLVVLFTKPRTGTFLGFHPNADVTGGNNPGQHSCEWVESAFIPFKGSVTLETE